jgi:aerobic carbon-monoxide dehydrogenase large subunit
MTDITQSTLYVGQSLRRREDIKFITGNGHYVDDMKLPGMLYLAILRSPHAHALVTGVDLSAAKASARVRLALAGVDLSGKIANIKPNWVIPGTVVPDRPVMAVDRVRFVGECVALIVAETHEAAYDALERIEVTYDVLPAVIDEEVAVSDAAPQLHDNVPNNITTYFKIGGGDYAAAARLADHVLRLRLVNNRLIPTCLETRAILAEPGVDGRLTIYLPSQVPHMHRRWIAETIGIPEHLLRVVAPDIGGGFGAKMHLYPEELLCAYLARELKCPVKWWESRSESHQATSHGRAHTELIEIAFRNTAASWG